MSGVPSPSASSLEIVAVIGGVQAKLPNSVDEGEAPSPVIEKRLPDASKIIPANCPPISPRSVMAPVAKITLPRDIQ
jgi:hypothetical protein